jgi:hypothetical protein
MSKGGHGSQPLNYSRQQRKDIVNIFLFGISPDGKTDTAMGYIYRYPHCCQDMRRFKRS